MKQIGNYTLLLFCISAITIAAQKGVSPNATNNHQPTIGNTYAVIVGISNYQSPQIPDLEFAHRDAIAFSDWLKSSGGGRIVPENVISLTNDSATIARVSDALTWLMDTCREDDLAIIYFSGHGDVETKIRDQWGFLLCYDSPARNYISGAYPINYLQSVISTISLDKKAKVLVITDACHAGKLAGSRINGSALTNANLAQQYANEAKILSCQSNEFSIEGKQWGNGRGVFSWVLIDGLKGLADSDEDQQINLMEIGRYLEENVPVQTSPHQQYPITVGDRTQLVAHVDPQFKNESKNSYNKEHTAFQAVNMRGMENGFLNNKDSLVQRKYRLFLEAIESKNLIQPKGSCANDLYELLKDEPSLASLKNLMRRNLAIAFQEEVQQALNALLDDDEYEINNWENHPEKYVSYPLYLYRAMELLGERHIAIKSLRSKKLFFESYLLSQQKYKVKPDATFSDSIIILRKSKLFEAIKLEPQAAYLYNAIAGLYVNQTPCQSDSVVYWDKKAIEIAPNWLKPMLEIGFEYLLCQSNACKTAPWIEKAFEERPQSYLANLYLSWLRQWQGQIEDSKRISMHMIEQKPMLFNAYATMAMTLCKIEGDYIQAKEFVRKSLFLDSSILSIIEPMADAMINMGEFDSLIVILENTRNKSIVEKDPICISYLAEAYFYKRNYTNGLTLLNKTFDLNLGAATFYHVRMKFWEGRIYLAQGFIAKAKKAFLEMFEMDKSTNGLFVWAFAWLAECYLKENNTQVAEEYFIKACNYHFCGDGMDTPEPREEAHYFYARFLMNQKRLQEAKLELEKAISERRMGYWGEYGMAVYYANLSNEAQTMYYLEKALENQFPFIGLIKEEDSFENIKRSIAFKQLITKYSKRMQSK